MENENSILQGSKEEVTGAISAFEEILSAMPNDRVALETLYEGYAMLGESEKAGDYLARLTQTVLDEQDTDEAERLLPKLQKRMDDHPDLPRVITEVEKLLGLSDGIEDRRQETTSEPADMPEKSDESPDDDDLGEVRLDTTPPPAPDKASPPPPPDSASKSGSQDITTELSLAWNILEAKIISEEEYSSVVHDLSERANKSLDVPVTVLHVLEDTKSQSLDKVLQFIARDTNTAYIELSRFEYAEIEFSKQLPEDFLRNRGAVVFEFMESDAMVGILNPYDKALSKDIEEIMGCRCHYYLARGSDYDFAIHKILRDDDLPVEKDSGLVVPPGGGRKSNLRLKTSG